jgi:hypothetical protein
VLPEKWEPVFREEARQNKELGSVHDSIKTGQTLVAKCSTAFDVRRSDIRGL